MRKTPESEHQLKLAIRDIVARNPLVSVAALQRDLAERGFKTNQGNTLDWYYVAKVVRKLNREKALAVDSQKIGGRKGIELLTKVRDKTTVDRIAEMQEPVNVCRREVRKGRKMYVYGLKLTAHTF
jgi:hypothetical protein